MLIIAESEKSLIYYTSKFFCFEIIANNELISKRSVNKLETSLNIYWDLFSG